MFAVPVVSAVLSVSPPPCLAYNKITKWPGDTAYSDNESYTVEYGFSQNGQPGGGSCVPPGEMELATFRFERTAPTFASFTANFTVAAM